MRDSKVSHTPPAPRERRVSQVAYPGLDKRVSALSEKGTITDHKGQPMTYWGGMAKLDDGTQLSAPSATAAISSPVEAVAMVQVPKERLEHWLEYWNRATNERAMDDALNFLMDEIEKVLHSHDMKGEQDSPRDAREQSPQGE